VPLGSSSCTGTPVDKQTVLSDEDIIVSDKSLPLTVENAYFLMVFGYLHFVKGRRCGFCYFCHLEFFLQISWVLTIFLSVVNW